MKRLERSHKPWLEAVAVTSKQEQCFGCLPAVGMQQLCQGTSSDTDIGSSTTAAFVYGLINNLDQAQQLSEIGGLPSQEEVLVRQHVSLLMGCGGTL